MRFFSFSFDNNKCRCFKRVFLDIDRRFDVDKMSVQVKCIPSVTRISLLIHLCGALWFGFTAYQDQMYHNAPIFNRFGGRAQFLTMITLYLTCAASALAFIVDLIQVTTKLLDTVKLTKDGYANNDSRLIALRDELMSSWVATLGLFVPLLYWGIAAVDLDGIHNAELEKITPLFGWFNHSLHTVPLLYSTLIVTLVNYEYISLRGMFMRASLLTGTYIPWIAYCAKVNGVWAYDILEKQNRVEFVIFISFCVAILFILNLVSRKIATLSWNPRRRDQVMIDMEKRNL